MAILVVMDDAPALIPEAPQKRWPGVLLSFFVPGFGLVRSGQILRGIAWFFALQGLSGLLALLALWRSIPFWALAAAWIVGFSCYISMLVDSFRPGRLNSRLWVAFFVALLVILVAPTAASFFERVFVIPTDGMAPTLRGESHGTPDHVFADRVCYAFSSPKRGDLVVFRTTGIDRIEADTFFVQRLVGFPGEKIEIHDGHVFANGRVLGAGDGIPDFVYTTGPSGSGVSYDVPQDHYLMLGDNSPNSFDGRYWGYLPKANVFGRIARIYYPFSRASVPR